MNTKSHNTSLLIVVMSSLIEAPPAVQPLADLHRKESRPHLGTFLLATIYICINSQFAIGPTARQSLSTHSPRFWILPQETPQFFISEDWNVNKVTQPTQTRGELNYDSFPISETAQREDLSLAARTL